ncbi:MAG: phage terminase large subunit family protein [Acidobacteriota bacterium]|nr:phage terminase large subunit family protein [Acidobacteriota bacterium]
MVNERFRRLWNERIAGGWAPPKRSLTSEWAEANRVLPADTPHPGKYRLEMAAYQKEMMDAALRPEVDIVVYMLAAQLGKNTVSEAQVGHMIDEQPAPILYFYESEFRAKLYSKKRIGPLISQTPCLARKVRDGDGKESILFKQFPGGWLQILGMNAEGNFASNTARYAFIDECDRADRPTKEGDQIDLIWNRIKNFPGRTMHIFSTPGDEKTSIIYPWYKQSNRQKYWVPCVCCGEFQELKLKYMFFVDGDGEEFRVQEYKGVPDEILDAYPRCQKCEDAFYYRDLRHLLTLGEWRADRETIKRIVGFNMSELYSPFRETGHIETIRAYFNSRGYPEKERAFANTRMGWVFKRSVKLTPVEELKARAETRRRTAKGQIIIPYGGVVLTLQVDTQDNRLEWELIATGKGEESWSVDYGILWGDPALEDVWKALDKIRTRPYLHETGRMIYVMATMIDSGGHRTQAVYNYCRGKLPQNVWCIKGMNAYGKPLVCGPPKDFDGKKNVTVSARFMLGSDTAKDTFWAFVAVKEEGPRYRHFADHYPDTFYSGLFAEEPVVLRRGGKFVQGWNQVKDRNEPVDLSYMWVCNIQVLREFRHLDLDEVVDAFHREELPVRGRKKKRGVGLKRR